MSQIGVGSFGMGRDKIVSDRAASESFDDFFQRALGCRPFGYQKALAERLAATDVLMAPTGLGKTAAVTLAWAWGRLHDCPNVPRRLVWCLPMRTLVEQTARDAKAWLAAAWPSPGRRPGVHVLMGGEVDGDWRLFPERDAVLVGTQDMLVSRALMRGYGMGRFGWPIDYGLLHTDALWVFDEVQLMGASLATSTQIEGFRRARHAPEHAAPQLARSLWISATLRPEWLRTAEFLAPPRVLHWQDHDRATPEARKRVDAVKRLRQARTVLDAEDVKRPQRYAERLAKEVVAAHRPGATTLVIVNTVRRAQAVAAAVARAVPKIERLLVHSRFRPAERAALAPRLAETGERIVVATQAVEAGVNMTSAVLFTELAPTASLIQRFGRCNRHGEMNEAGAEIRWIDLPPDDTGAAAPYEEEALAAARRELAKLDGAASPAALEALALDRPGGGQVIRPRDFEELFDTDPDLSGYDLDISPYVREGDDLTVLLFWRDWSGHEPKDEPPPRREELCPAPIGDVNRWIEILKDAAENAIFIENPLGRGAERWTVRKPGARLRPGQTLMLAAALGGYTTESGFDADSKTHVEPLPAPAVQDGVARGDAAPGAATGDDPGSNTGGRTVVLSDHLDHVAAAARSLAAALGLPENLAEALEYAGAWHDVGKAHPEFALRRGQPAGAAFLAKGGPAPKEKGRRYFRHELASALAFLAQHESATQADLVAYLIASHHGKVRLGLRALPGERASPPEARIARGVQDGDVLPRVTWTSGASAETILDLGLMVLGGEGGRPSWAARMQRLLAAYGPFRLAYLEALLRMADWRASKAEQEGADHE